MPTLKGTEASLSCVQCFFFFKIFFIFKDWGRERDREGNINVWLPLM